MTIQLTGSKDFPVPPEQTFRLLTDPDALIKAMPGLKSLNKRTETSYDAELEVGVAGIKGVYKGSLEMRDVLPGEGYRMTVNGEGPMGFMEADVQVALTPVGESGTRLKYDGTAKVGGTVAGVGQRVLSGVAKFITNQFFNGLLKQATSR
ncbi:carbon monoxide dehydrogenase subunit G [Alicyclobacillus tolerans]|uniref:SRPBCC family protein n=1 Tax=Alicyclobacillus tolerans TaxID=90970 RepID=UPI001F367D83|nr:carbon monoxide dehydrogenase subunit G [Alicyclobacillus tolerans]MCF8564334.1 carbon monoxide dehydrogenase subunit G [Alicyclobacillus tolerans]